MNDLLMKRGATISDCGQYRYSLTRKWQEGVYSLPIIMLNPSTADADIDDPTIRRCMSFARREGFGGIRVVNLFAFRATSPDDMRAAADPVGPSASEHLDEVLSIAARADLPVLAAWGTQGSFRGRDVSVKLSAKGWGTKMVCLGVTKDGHPRHPLYVAAAQAFVPFGGRV